MLKKILFFNIFFILIFNSNVFSFEQEAEQLIRLTTENAKKIILENMFNFSTAFY